MARHVATSSLLKLPNISKVISSFAARAYVVIAVLVSSAASPVQAQHLLARSVSAAGAAVRPWASGVDEMLRNGSFVRSRIDADTMLAGRVHERLAQMHQGLPVYGGQLVRQLNGVDVESVFGRFFENVSVPTVTPAITAEDATALAVADAGEGASGTLAELGILPRVDDFVLVYRTLVRSPWDVRTYDVDATTGLIIDVESRVRHQEQPSIGIGRGVLNDQKKLSVLKDGATFSAIDVLRPSQAFTLDFRGSSTRFNQFLQTGIPRESDIATTTTASWTDPAVVDAHVYTGWVYDYYFHRFGRRGLDDHDLPIVGIVHPLARQQAALFPDSIVGSFINNAAYLGDGFMLYGDGDGFVFDYLAGALDVVAHELTHGVTDFTSGLISRDEPGALNEAFSDIMATGVEFFHLKPGQGPQKGPNFTMGEDVTRFAPGFVRSMASPMANNFPDHYSLRRHIGTSFDDGGEHVNSTIVSHAFYLAVAGGTNRVSGITVQGVGVANMPRMEAIFYRAFVTKLTPMSQFSDARAATLQAATELFGQDSFERSQLLQAWNAVGVP